MKKRPDRIFHLSVTIVAILITCISVWSIVQNLPPTVQKRISSFATTSVTNHDNDQSTSTSPSSAAQPQAMVGGSVTAHPSGSTMLRQIQVVGVGSHVHASDIHRVKMMLERVDSPALIEQSLHLKLKKPAVIQVVSGAKDYQNALLKLGLSSSDASALSTTSGGFTQNNTVVLPMNPNADDTDLANTITHELTHVFINQNVGALPSWLNEGIAVFMGIRGQKVVESAVSFSGDERQFAENILGVTASHQLQPLTGNEEAILSGRTTYDYELQDWLAVSDLVNNHGLASIRKYLNLISRHAQASQAFVVAFGETEGVFNTQFNALMKTSSAATDGGGKFALSIAPSYHGNIGFLQHGQSSWEVFQAEPGDVTMSVAPDGAISGGLSQVKSSVGQSPSDNHTLYISLLPSTSLQYQGHRVTDCGFAFDIHNGLYAFQDSWLTFENGDTIYLSNAALFGVSVTSAVELSVTDPLVSVLAVE